MRKGQKIPEEIKKKLLEANLGRTPWNKGNKGACSKETIERQSKSHLGQVAWNKGIMCSEETKKKISKANKGKPSPMGMLNKKHSEDTKRKQSEAKRGKMPKFIPDNTGRRHTDMARKKMSNSAKGRTFSEEIRQKMSNAHRGEKNSSWKGGITPLNVKIRNSIEANLWRKSCMERDNFTCQRCEIVGGNLNVHHINNFSEFLELRTSIENGITLCKNCHIEFHKKYGKKNNTKSQLEEFLIINK